MLQKQYRHHRHSLVLLSSDTIRCNSVTDAHAQLSSSASDGPCFTVKFTAGISCRPRECEVVKAPYLPCVRRTPMLNAGADGFVDTFCKLRLCQSLQERVIMVCLPTCYCATGPPS